MSDDEDFMLEEDDWNEDDIEEGSDLEEGDEDEGVEIENQYYRSKDLEEEEGINAAIKGFQKVLDMEHEKEDRHGEWSFKALKKIVKLTFKLGDQEKLLKRYQELLSYNSKKNGITENDLFKGITKILDSVSSAAATQTELVLQLYEMSLAAMKAANNENLWFKTNLKLAQRMFDKKMFKKLEKILADLTASCMLEDGTENPKKGNQLLDIYSLAIQMYMEKKDRKRTKEYYEKGFETARKNPGTLNSKLAIFHFVGGKLKMEEHQWNDAYSAFFEAFNFFEEAGSRFKIPCLKYILLANMLMLSDISPFDSPETKTLQNHAEIKPMSELLSAYQNNEINRFEKILKEHRSVIMGDPFIAQFMENVLREIRTQALLKMIKPYTRVHLPFLAKQLNISTLDVQELLVFLILSTDKDSRIEGQIDQVNQLLYLDQGGSVAKYGHLQKWTSQLHSLHNALLNKVA
ncbi:COP9 signalosome complex subunit 2 [Balamuthia mandrillaris]